MDYAPLIEKRRQRLDELEQEIADPTLFDNRSRAEALMREHRRTQALMQTWQELCHAKEAAEEARTLTSGDDAELAEMATEELAELEPRIAKLEENVQYSLLPRDETEDRDAIVEIRAGTGGDEAALFAADLLGMYQRYAEGRGWRVEILDASPNAIGGFREVTARISGEEVFRYLKYESGVHRVQRVPATETQGRIHTSTATVAILPEAEEVDVEIKPEDLRIETCRSGGAGGQHVNRTESAVQIFHLPTGIMVRCEEGRSQLKNKETGMRILRARLFEMKQREAQQSYSAQRRALIGSGGREEKIRTYNFPQNRLTDHRIGYTSYNLDTVIASGAIEDIISHMQHAEMQERMDELQ
ncbi:MAG: peptide chain release factor 1 [Akkermansiaceae bacterium]|nr:peptide chain release factor 1 [Akkermansiaceae bacterium]